MVIEAAQELVNAKTPVILVGTGAVTSKLVEDIKDLAETLNIPVATTPKAKALSRRSPIIVRSSWILRFASS